MQFYFHLSSPFAVNDVVSVPVGLSVSVCDLGTLVVESREKLEPTGRVGLARNPHFLLLLPGQRGRQSGAFGVFWSLGLTESSLQNKMHNLV